MKNDQLEYYIQHNISPERQNIDDIETHYERRKKLYRQCGIPEIAFRNAEILEVGPGGGYNTLAFFHWNCKHVDLVEANPQGIRDMKLLFAQQKISDKKYEIFESEIENYNTNRKYDIIIAEGFIQHLYNQVEVIDKLKSLVNDKGIIVITCGSRIDCFVEVIKGMIGKVLTQNMKTYEEKIKYLTDIFKPQLEKLPGVSKVPEDWVKDHIFNPEGYNDKELTIIQAMQYFTEAFDVQGCSPQMFTDYSWSKDIWYDYRKDYKEQFAKKRLSLLLANMPEIILPEEQVNKLSEQFEIIIKAEAEYERTLDFEKINEILQAMDNMESLIMQKFSDTFIKVFLEIKELLLTMQKGEKVNMEQYPYFFAAFGRTQQYISFIKK